VASSKRRTGSPYLLAITAAGASSSQAVDGLSDR